MIILYFLFWDGGISIGKIDIFSYKKLLFILFNVCVAAASVLLGTLSLELLDIC